MALNYAQLQTIRGRLVEAQRTGHLSVSITLYKDGRPLRSTGFYPIALIIRHRGLGTLPSNSLAWEFTEFGKWLIDHPKAISWQLSFAK